jgi:hypothetical protein
MRLTRGKSLEERARVVGGGRGRGSHLAVRCKYLHNTFSLKKQHKGVVQRELRRVESVIS